MPSSAARTLISNSNRAVLRAHPEDIVILQLQTGADQERLSAFLQEVHGTALYTVTMGSTSFLYVQAERGRAPELLKKIQMSAPAIRAEQNHLYPKATPNDPAFSEQWDLNLMHWSQARDSGIEPPNATTLWVIDGGLAPLAGELADVAIQYDFSDVSTSDGPIEAPFDVNGHGTAVCTVAAATDNAYGLAGAANFEGTRVAIGMLRVDSQYTLGTTINFINAMAFLYNSDVPVGPVNLSRDSVPPNFLNADSALQLAAGKLREKGFQVVMAAGNHRALDPSPEINIRRVAACQQDGKLASFSNFGPFAALAPGENVPLYNPATPGAIFHESGTSFAAPRWCAAILHVMAALPTYMRTAVYADQIVYRTATVTSQGMRIPNLQAAIRAARSLGKPVTRPLSSTSQSRSPAQTQAKSR